MASELLPAAHVGFSGSQLGGMLLPKQVKQPKNQTGNECKTLRVDTSILLVHFKQSK